MINIAVVMGGASAERDISLSTGRQILGSLDSAKYRVYALDTHTRDVSRAAPGAAAPIRSADGAHDIVSVTQISQAAASDKPDVVIIALHGKGGEDGTIQGYLDTLGIPYTGSGVLASALAMDKARCKVFLTAVGIRMPGGLVVCRGDSAPAGAPNPCVVKPVSQGSSDGVTIVMRPEELAPALELAFRHDETVLVEEFVQGTEITCAVIGNTELEALPLVEIVPAKGVYDREAKYTPGATDEIVPARISPEATAEAKRIGLACHRALGCRGMSRTDMIVADTGEIYALEVNTIPGMTPTSLLPRAAQAAGYSFSQLLDKLIGFALER